MKHNRKGRALSRTASHRRALLRNLVTELFRHERIETTQAKAKEARVMAERLITFAKRGDLHARRHVDRFVMSPDVTRKLFSTIAPWYAERQGGYTRIIKLRHRLGDGAEMAYLELVKSEAQEAADRKARLAAAEAKAAAKEAKAAKAAKEAKEAEGAEEADEAKEDKETKDAKKSKKAKAEAKPGKAGKAGAAEKAEKAEQSKKSVKFKSGKKPKM